MTLVPGFESLRVSVDGLAKWSRGTRIEKKKKQEMEQARHHEKTKIPKGYFINDMGDFPLFYCTGSNANL